MFGRERIETKSLDEVRAMRPAGLLVAQCLTMLHAATVPGRTTAELDALAEAFIRDNGGRPSFVEVPGYRHTLCTSVNEVVCHGIPDMRPLQEGDIINIDISVYYKGPYHYDIVVS